MSKDCLYISCIVISSICSLTYLGLYIFIKHTKEKEAHFLFIQNPLICSINLCMVSIFLVVSKIKDNSFMLSLTFTLVNFYQTIIIISVLFFVILFFAFDSHTGDLLTISLIAGFIETIPTVVLYILYKQINKIYIEIILGNNNNSNNNNSINNNNNNNNNDINNNNNNLNGNNNDINNEINLINGNINNININNFDINNFNFNNNNMNEENALLNNNEQ